MNPDQLDNNQRRARGFAAYPLSVTLGCVSAWGIGSLLLGLDPTSVLLPVAAFAALLGCATGEHIGEAIMMGVPIALSCYVLYQIGPQGAAFRAGMVGAAVGFCVGKLVHGIWKEIKSR